MSDSDSDDCPDLEDMSAQVELRRQMRGMKMGDGAIIEDPFAAAAAQKKKEAEEKALQEAEEKARKLEARKNKALEEGDRVVLHSLKSAKFNGKRGTLGQWQADKGRWTVNLDGASSIAVRAGNIKIVLDEMTGGFFSGKNKTNLVEDTKDTKDNKDKETDSKKRKDNEIPFIRQKKIEKSESLFMPEVQAAIKSGQMDTSYINDDFLGKIGQNEYLMKALQDPRLARAMQDIADDPKKALEKYKGNKELFGFVKKFMGFMGQHFEGEEQKAGGKGKGSGAEAGGAKAKAMTTASTPRTNLANKKTKGKALISEARAQDEEEVVDFGGRKVPKSTLNAWMSDPKIMMALNDPQTSMMIGKIAQDKSGDLFRKYQGHPSIQLLLQAGILVPPQE